MKLPGTITITNFGGPLTRRADGNIDSGMTKFNTSWGYDSYSKPGNLTWMEQPTSILTIGSIAGAVITMDQHVDYPFSYAYIFTNNGTLRKVNVATDTPSVIGALFNTPSAANGADTIFFGTTATVKALVIAGGGGGGKTGGGGGAGGYQEVTSVGVIGQAYSVTVGAGGAGSSSTGAKGTNGSNSVFASATSIGGGGGGSSSQAVGANGGSGGGGANSNPGGAGTVSQGTSGGTGGDNSNSGGGGGATSAGASCPGGSHDGGAGGTGTSSSISGSAVTRGGGGGGAGDGIAGAGGAGGAGGGGAAGATGAVGSDGSANTGGGGGAGENNTGGTGGSGVVIISFPEDGSSGVSITSTGGTITNVGGNQIHTFTTSGTFTAAMVGGSVGNMPLEKIFFGDGNGIQKINVDGSAPASIVGTSSITTGVPRPMATFLGKIYFGNGNNIGEIDSTELITTGDKFAPALPVGVIVRDLDVTPDGNYLTVTAMKYNPTGGFLTPDTAMNAGIESYQFLWNGIDSTYTSYETQVGIAMTANSSFGDKNYSVGYDGTGAAVLSGSTKFLSLFNNNSPFHSGFFSVGNMLGIATTEYDNSTGRTNGSAYFYGKYDNETPEGLYRMFRLSAPVRSDVMSIPTVANVSNILRVPSVLSGDTVARQGKVYFSTTEASSADNDNYLCRLWKFSTAPIGLGSVLSGVYETQTQIFSKKVAIKEVRLYTEPLVANNSFTIDLIGSGGSVMGSGSKTFTVGTNVTAGTDMVAFNPPVAPTYALGVRITNSSVLGTKNWTGTKMEVDIAEGGK